MTEHHKVLCVFEDGRSVTVTAAESETLFAAALGQGVMLLTDCREGACQTCLAHCASGTYWHGDISDEALSEEEAARGGVLPCRLHISSPAVIEFPYVLDRLPDVTRVSTRVAGLNEVADGIVHLVLETAPGDALSFLAGQYVRIRVPDTEVTRAYSMANAPGSARLEFYVRHIEGGAMSTWLRDRARIGDQVTIEGPLGRFYLRPNDRPKVFIAGGTGLAPILAMFETMARDGGNTSDSHLLYGANRSGELFGLDRVRRLSPGCRISTIVAESEAAWPGPVGFVTDLMQPSLGNLTEAEIYLCGPPPMIDAAQSRIRDLPMRSVVHAERFVAG